MTERPQPHGGERGTTPSSGLNRRDVLRMAAQTMVAAPALVFASRKAAAQAVLMAAAGRPDGAQAAESGAAEAARAKLPLITKPIPSSGEKMPVIGIGTNAFHLDQYDDLKIELKRMHELGGTVIDSANDYYDSELVVGRALAELNIRKQMFVTTKFNSENGQPDWVPLRFRDTIFGQGSFARSLQRLKTDHVDLQFIHHNPSIDRLMPLLQELKKTGKARYIGITGLRPEDNAVLVDKMRQYPLDFIQIDYSLGNRAAESAVLPMALERKIAVMLDTPLSGRRGSQRGSLIKLVGDNPLPAWAAEIDVTSWSQFFLKYAVSHPAVTCAIPGSTKIEHLVDNQFAGHGRLPDAAMRRKMEEYWDA